MFDVGWEVVGGLPMVTASTLAILLAAGAGTPAEARLPARLIVACSPKVQCTDRTKELHRVQVGVSYQLQLPLSQATTVSGSKQRTIRRALRFRTREIRPAESRRVMFYLEVGLSPSSAIGSFVGTRTLRLTEVERRAAPIACTLDLTVCSESRLAALGVPPSRRARLCERALRRLRRRVGIIDIATPPVTFTVDSCPRPKPPKTTTTSSTTTSSSTSTTTSSTTSTTTG